MPRTPPLWTDRYSPILYTASSSSLPSPSPMAPLPPMPTIVFPDRPSAVRQAREVGVGLTRELDNAVGRGPEVIRPTVRTVFDQLVVRQSSASTPLDEHFEPPSTTSFHTPSIIEISAPRPVAERTPPKVQQESQASGPITYPPLPPSTSGSPSSSPSPSLRVSVASPSTHTPPSPTSSASSLGSPAKASLDNSLLREHVDVALNRLSGGWWSPVITPSAGFTLPTAKPNWVAQQQLEEAKHRSTPPVERLRRILGDDSAGTPLSPVAEGAAEDSESKRNEGPVERGRRARSTGDLTRLITQPKPKPKHSQFYMREEMVVFSVQGMLYRVHRHHLEHDSAYFRRLFLSRGTSERGRTDETAIVLSQVTAEEFNCLLSYVYNGVFEPELMSVGDWTALLRVSTTLRFNKIRTHAIRALSAALDALSPVEALVLAVAHDVPEWLAPGYSALVRRPTPLEDEEAEMLGARATARVARAREKAGEEIRRLRRRSGAPAGEEEWEEVVQRVVGEVFWPEAMVAT